MQLDSELVDQFVKFFFGYGNLNSEIWLIGMEEGGGMTSKKSINAWTFGNGMAN